MATAVLSGGRGSCRAASARLGRSLALPKRQASRCSANHSPNKALAPCPIWNNISTRNPADLKKIFASCCGFPASAPIAPIRRRRESRRLGSRSVQAAWGEGPADRDGRASIGLCRIAPGAGCRWRWSMAITTCSRWIRWANGFHHLSSRPAATGISTPAARRTTKARCSRISKAPKLGWRPRENCRCSSKYLIEGEEEVGSQNFRRSSRRAQAARLRRGRHQRLSQFGPGQPAITYGLRGIAYYELRLIGPKQDLHSGTFGGGVTNPANALCRMMTALWTSDGRIQVPGFYDDVLPLSDANATVPLAAVRRSGIHEAIRRRRPHAARPATRRSNAARPGPRAISTASGAAIKAKESRPYCRPGLARNSASAWCRIKIQRRSPPALERCSASCCHRG